MRGRLNYIELRVVTQRIYERAGWASKVRRGAGEREGGRQRKEREERNL